MDIISRLRAEREALVDRLAEIDKILSQFEEVERAARRIVEAIPVVSVTTGDASPPSRLGQYVVLTQKPHRYEADGGGAQGRVKTPIEEFEKAVVDVLREANQPMDRVALYEALMARGIVIGDGDRDKELNALSARVYRMTQAGLLENKRGEGYRLKEVGAHAEHVVGDSEDLSREETESFSDVEEDSHEAPDAAENLKARASASEDDLLV